MNERGGIRYAIPPYGLKVVADIKVGDGPRAFGAFLRR
jgi:hypothetical protein